MINSYFDILVRYGDQSVTLGFGDLIEVEPSPGGMPDVRLRNLEYDLTRSIKKAVYGFQSLDAVLARLDEPVRLTAFVTPRHAARSAARRARRWSTRWRASWPRTRETISAIRWSIPTRMRASRARACTRRTAYSPLPSRSFRPIRTICISC